MMDDKTLLKVDFKGKQKAQGFEPMDKSTEKNQDRQPKEKNANAPFHAPSLMIYRWYLRAR
ncbi:hypothetical protein N7539_004162 [Penicillium diatomitis]|uniref:Uncharacterized protein n=1 Tax=Penicillium diatomitis TaxID=2819901 RepID=A0A9W9XDG7_9EURO|nr:uncharacterized protein N7539_004162 [Penicillium diatomitis]KAJ5489272.1 hypothetical protein N7539_004162 [Penicillium diatomitis]